MGPFKPLFVFAASCPLLLVACTQSHQRAELTPPEVTAPQQALPPIEPPVIECPPQATTFCSLGINLDSMNQVPPAWDLFDPAGTSNFSTSLTIYDHLGARSELTLYFAKTDALSWEWHAVHDQQVGGEYGNAGPFTEHGNGMLLFTEEGALSETVLFTPLVVPASEDGAPTQITLDFGTSITNGGDGFDGLTHFPTPCNVHRIDQDGHKSGSGDGCAIEP